MSGYVLTDVVIEQLLAASKLVTIPREREKTHAKCLLNIGDFLWANERQIVGAARSVWHL